jgi:hypothetical protein
MRRNPRSHAKTNRTFKGMQQKRPGDLTSRGVRNGFPDPRRYVVLSECEPSKLKGSWPRELPCRSQLASGSDLQAPEVAQAPSERCWTQVWVGRSAFDMRCRAHEVIALMLRPQPYPIARVCFLIDWNSFRRLQ